MTHFGVKRPRPVKPPRTFEIEEMVVRNHDFTHQTMVDISYSLNKQKKKTTVFATTEAGDYKFSTLMDEGEKELLLTALSVRFPKGVVALTDPELRKNLADPLIVPPTIEGIE